MSLEKKMEKTASALKERFEFFNAVQEQFNETKEAFFDDLADMLEEMQSAVSEEDNKYCAIEVFLSKIDEVTRLANKSAEQKQALERTASTIQELQESLNLLDQELTVAGGEEECSEEEYDEEEYDEGEEESSKKPAKAEATTVIPEQRRKIKRYQEEEFEDNLEETEKSSFFKKLKDNAKDIINTVLAEDE